VRDYLVERFDAQVDLIESGGGVFEIVRDGRLLFSKKESDRFPTNDEIEIFGGV
jgi:predicted Rdx family selenoprotein